MTESARTSSESPNLPTRIIRWLAYPISAIAGFWFANTIVRNSAYDNLNRHGAFFDIKPEHIKKLDDATQLGVERMNQGVRVQLAEEMAPLQKAFTADITKRMQSLGVGTLREQWKFIHKSQRQTALRYGVGGATVALGVVLAIANSKTLTHLFSHDGAKTDTEKDSASR